MKSPEAWVVGKTDLAWLDGQELGRVSYGCGKLCIVQPSCPQGKRDFGVGPWWLVHNWLFLQLSTGFTAAGGGWRICRVTCPPACCRFSLVLQRGCRGWAPLEGMQEPSHDPLGNPESLMLTLLAPWGERYLNISLQHPPRGSSCWPPTHWPGSQKGCPQCRCSSPRPTRWDRGPYRSELLWWLTAPCHSQVAGTPPPHPSGPSRRRRSSPTCGCGAPPPSRRSGWGRWPAGGCPGLWCWILQVPQREQLENSCASPLVQQGGIQGWRGCTAGLPPSQATWALNAGVLHMVTVVFSPRPGSAFGEVPFLPGAVDLIQPDLTCPFSVASSRCHRQQRTTLQLPAHNPALGGAPAIVTHCPPRPIVEYLYPPGAAAGASCQTKEPSWALSGCACKAGRGKRRRGEILGVHGAQLLTRLKCLLPPKKGLRGGVDHPTPALAFSDGPGHLFVGNWAPSLHLNAWT